MSTAQTLTALSASPCNPIYGMRFMPQQGEGVLKAFTHLGNTSTKRALRASVVMRRMIPGTSCQGILSPQ